jgi:NAD(P)H-hydrate epimerase
MELFLTPEQMRQADRKAIEGYAIPSPLLMENAARSTFEYIAELFQDVPSIFSILVVCGSGNNGGDGFALARHLNDFFMVDVLWIGKEEKMSPETHTNYQICKSIGMNIRHIPDTDSLDEIDWNYDCIIDAMIGVGGSENIRGIANDILKILNNLPAFKIAVDAPTGLNTLTGKAGENCFRADLTVTMYAKKVGQVIGDGPDYCGEIMVANLGAPYSCVDELADTFAFDYDDLNLLLPPRKRRSSKFDYGRLVIIGGSKRFPGAGALAANAAIKSGVGLVELFSEVLHPQILPEVICYTDNQSGNYWQENMDIIKQRCLKADAILIGPGLGDDNYLLFNELLEELINDKKVILDADAIMLIDKTKKYNDNLIITPHLGEFARLIGKNRDEIDENPFDICKASAEKLNCIIHLKHYPSISSDGHIAFLTLNGNPGMASGGSGDVLAGIVASFAAMGMSSLTAVALGSFIHAAAGDNYSDAFGEQTLTASDLIEALPFVFGSDNNEDNNEFE